MTDLQIPKIQNNIPVKTVSNPNFYGTRTAPAPQNAVEISDKNKKGKNNIRSTMFLVTLGIGAAILGWVKFHKTTPAKEVESELSAELKEVQQIFKDIFKRDINAEETKDFAQRYKKIIDSKTPDNDREYCEKLLDELCKDRQTKKPKIHNWISDFADANPKCVNGGMATSPDGTYIDVYAFNYNNTPLVSVPGRGMFESLFHETHHVKQDEIIYRTDKEFFLQHLLDKFVFNGNGEQYKEMLQKNGGNVQKTINEVKQLLSEQVERHWGSFEPFAKNSAEYQEGLRLIEGKKTYKFFGDCTEGEYENQIIEKGAYADGKKAERLFDILTLLTF